MRKILFCFWIILIVTTSGCADNSGRNAFKAMTFNIRMDNKRDSINAWPNRASMVVDFMKTVEPDIIGMQEVLPHQYDLLDSLLTDYSSAGVGRNDGARSGEMNPLFYRKEKFDLVRTKTFWLSPTPEIPGTKDWGSSLPRIVTWMELVDKKTHDHFFVFNTHFAHDSDSARIMSSRILLNSVDSISGGFPFIVTGDFNMLPTSTGYSILTGPSESVPILEDSFSVSDKTPGGPQYTFNGFSDKQGAGRIDYIFVKPGLKVFEHNTIVKKENGVYISDHWPVETIVSLK